MPMPEPRVAYELLAKYEIPFERLDHEAITSVRDTEIVLPGQQVKNLFLKTKKGREHFLVILRDEKAANLKALEETLEVKRLSFVHEEELMDLLHCEAGTVTPFGLLFDTDHKVQVIVDEEVDPELTVGFHPFVNTTTLNIPYREFERLLVAIEHPIRRVMC